MVERPRSNTGTGGVLEGMVSPALIRGGYIWQCQVDIGNRPGGRRHKVDFLVQHELFGHSIPVSLKWQQSGGTAEQKIPFEVMCLIRVVQRSQGKMPHAYLVLGGDGWTLRDFYVSGGLREYLLHTEFVRIVTLEGFIAKANRGEL